MIVQVTSTLKSSMLAILIPKFFDLYNNFTKCQDSLYLWSLTAWLLTQSLMWRSNQNKLRTGLKIVNLLCLLKKMKALNNFQAQKIEKGLYLLLEETYRESKHGFETFVFFIVILEKKARRRNQSIVMHQGTF